MWTFYPLPWGCYCFSVAKSCLTLWPPWTGACQVCLSLTISQSLPKSCPLNRWCHPTISSYVALFSCLPIFPSVRAVSNESALCIRWPKNWSLSFSIRPFNKYSRLIFFKIGWFDLLAVQGTLKSLLQHHSSKASILWRSASIMVQLSHLTTGKSTALPVWTFVGKVMSLLFNTLSRFVIAFLPRSDRLLISQLQALSAVILQPKKRKSVTTSTFSLSICQKWWDRMPQS